MLRPVGECAPCSDAIVEMMKTLLLLAMSLGLGIAAPALADADSVPPQKPVFHAHKYAPPHLSPGWRALYDTYQPFWELPDPQDLDGWRAWDRSKQVSFIERDGPLVDQLGAELREMSMNGVRVVEITPRTVKAADKALMYMHGGAWSSFSPESTLVDTVPMADRLGIRVYAVDYVKAPFATLYEIIDQNVAAFEHLVTDMGYAPQDVGVYGCSAGGHLSLAVPNALRNRGIGLPGAAVAQSPMVDFTMTADTWITLEGQDPVVSREAYVRGILRILGITDYRDPVISPHLDENLADGMPPTLLQTGGKEVLLSDSLLMFQAMEAAGQVAKLDLYDGLPHCFTFVLPEAEESKIALAKQAAWFSEHLGLD